MDVDYGVVEHIYSCGEDKFILEILKLSCQAYLLIVSIGDSFDIGRQGTNKRAMHVRVLTRCFGLNFPLEDCPWHMFCRCFSPNVLHAAVLNLAPKAHHQCIYQYDRSGDYV